MKTIIPLFPIFLIINPVTRPKVEPEKPCDCNFINDYYPLHSGILEYERGNLEAAYTTFKKAFDKCTPKNTLYIYELDKMGEICVELNKLEEAEQYIRLSCVKGLNIEYLVEDSLYMDFFNSNYGKQLLADKNDLREEYLSSLNMELREELFQMKSDDQKYRQSGRDYFNENIDKVSEIGKRHTERLIQIFDSIGYPNSELVGNHTLDGGNITIDIILLHTEDSIRMNFFVPKMQEFVKSGTCDPGVVATMIDQHHLYNKRPQIYGTYVKPNNTYSNMIGRDSVNMNRISIGLPTLDQKEELDSLKKINYPWLDGE